MDAFVNVIRKDPKVCVKRNVMLDIYMRLPYSCQSKIGNDCLIQNVILEELNNIMGTTITVLDIELKMETSRIKNLESR